MAASHRAGTSLWQEPEKWPWLHVEGPSRTAWPRQVSKLLLYTPLPTGGAQPQSPEVLATNSTPTRNLDGTPDAGCADGGWSECASSGHCDGGRAALSPRDSPQPSRSPVRAPHLHTNTVATHCVQLGTLSGFQLQAVGHYLKWPLENKKIIEL